MTGTLIFLSTFFGTLFLLFFISKKTRPQIILVSRIFIAVVFIYSGFVKAVDPLGSTYKFIDYFNAFGMPSFDILAFPLAIILSSIEFLIGFGMLIGAYIRIHSWLAALFMLVFTPLTLILAISNPVSDCGCFGDALILTNWETFWKNIIIDLPIIMLLLHKTNLIDVVSKKLSFVGHLVASIFIIGISVYGYQHLPILDFRPYKIGKNIQEGMQIPEGAKPDVYASTFKYKNLETQDIVSFTEDELSTPVDQPEKWEFVDSETQLIEEGYHPPIHDFTITNDTDGDITEAVLNDENYTFIFVAYDLSKTNFDAFLKFEKLSEKLAETPNKTLCMTAALDNEIKQMQDSLKQALDYNNQTTTKNTVVYYYEKDGEISEFKENELPDDIEATHTFVGSEDMPIEVSKNLSFSFYICDPITLKTIVRANPGLVLIKKGTVIQKWHYRDMPDFEQISKDFLNK
jgi:uncharacterized membrane protein YphA (DoxX/SURF4 family)